MPVRAPSLTLDRLKALLIYQPNTGAFFWRTHRGNNGGGAVMAGELAGSQHGSGYIDICIDGRRYLAHRLAWFYMTGHWPAAMIDHRDGDRANNRWANLREATPAQNSRNRKVNSNSVLGVKGVRPCRGKFRASIRRNGKRIHLGTFSTVAEAAHAYAEASQQFHGEYGRAS